MIHLVIDKSSGVSIHRQIVRQICAMIDSGLLDGGDRLPTERTLCESYGISRGTVKAAYAELAQIGKIYTVQGSGTYIRESRPSLAQGRIRQQLAGMLAEAETAGIPAERITELLIQEQRMRRRRAPFVRVAWVACVREILEIARAQLGSADHVSLDIFWIEDIQHNPGLLDADYDLIITTENPYQRLSSLVKAQADKIRRISFAIDEESIIRAARLSANHHVLLADIDSLFMEVVQNTEGIFDEARHILRITTQSPELLHADEGMDVLILPTRDAFSGAEQILELERRFEASRRPVVYVGMHVDRGSMINYQTWVQQCWLMKNSLGICREGEALALQSTHEKIMNGF